MKVLLIQPSDRFEISLGVPPGYSQKARNYLPPLGLLYLAAHLKQRHDVRVVDLMATKRRPESIIETLAEFQPDLIGITTVISLWKDVLAVAGAVKRYSPGIPIAVGGANPTRYPNESLAHPEIDYVIVGTGQGPLMELCDALENERDVTHIDNCFSKKQPHRTLGPFPKLEKLDSYPSPDRTALPPTLYSLPFCPENPTTSMMSGLGCPFKCAFCDCRLLKPVHSRSAAAVLDEIAQVCELDIRSAIFQDELFTLKPSRVMEICRGINERGLSLNWAVKSRVDCITHEIVEAMVGAGCFNIHFGIESGSPSTLHRMRKGITLDQVRNAVKLVKSSGITCTGNFMIGYPGEDEDDIRRSIDLAQELEMNVTQFFLTVDIPGTELFDEALRNGRRKADPFREYTLNPESECLSNLYSSDKYSESRLFTFLEEAYASVRSLYDLKDGQNEQIWADM